MKTKIMIIVSIFTLAISSCTGQTLKDDSTLAKNTFIDCMKADIGQTIPEVGLTLLAVVTQILMAGAGNYVTQLDDIGLKYGADAEACAVKAVNTVLGAATGTPSHAEPSPALARASSVISSKGWKFKAN